MQIAHIVPIPHLYDPALWGDYFFAEALIALQSPRLYCEFYRERVAEGKVVLLDNSAYLLGTSVSSEDLVRMYDLINPTLVYAPDTLDRPEESERLTTAFVKTSGIDTNRIIGVVHGETMHSRLEMAHRYCRSLGIALAIPAEDFRCSNYLQNIKDYGTRVMLKRMWFCDQLARLVGMAGMKEGVPAVYLTGLGNPIEVYYNTHSWIVGVDSSTCCVHGSREVVFDFNLGVTKCEEKLDFHALYEEYQDRFIYKNVKIMQSWVCGR